MLLITVPQAGPLPAPTRQVTAQTSRLAELVQSLPDDAIGARWELANIALEALYESYASAMSASFEERPRSGPHRDKLARWQRATRGLMNEIDAARQRLLVGNDFSLFVDPRSQVLVVVNGQLLALTGLGRGDDQRLERAIVSRYCTLNACAHLSEEPAPIVNRLTDGRWEITQDRRPVYLIDHRLACRFDDLADRHAKAAACHGAAQEVDTLRHLVANANRQGQGIDWPVLAASRREAALGMLLILNASGAYVTVDLPYLARLDDTDWQTVVDELARRDKAGAEAPLIKTGDRLVSD